MKKLKLWFLTGILFTVLACDNETPEAVPTIDLAAESITYELVSQDSKFTGMVSVKGVIKNVGGKFQSGQGQQYAALYQKPHGGQLKLLAKVDFQTLEVGESLQVSSTAAWNVTTEFQPDFMLRIEYDPDILIDGNKHNDDRNPANNSLTKSGYGINDLFE